jgi:23S rRNA pseudouridine2605 synthase
MPRNRTDSKSSRSSRAGERSRGAGRASEHKAGRRDAESERLQKVLARAGLASRREVEDWIRAGRITINGEPAVLGVRVTPSDQVRLDGRLIRQVREPGVATVFLIHRSPGEPLQHVEGAEQPTSDEASEGTPILDRIPRRAGRRFISVSPMPRVDGGLELVTSDGDLASKLQRSMRSLTSEFSVRVHGELSSQGLEAILEGMLDTGQKLQVEQCVAAGGEGSNRWYSLSARGASGKDVRQLFERQGALVSRIMRTNLGPLALDRTLSRGRFRELSAAEVQSFLAAATAESPDEAGEPRA